MSTYDEFWRTRLEAKVALKRLKAMPNDPKLMQAYANAWAEHQKANMAQFMEECDLPIEFKGEQHAKPV